MTKLQREIVTTLRLTWFKVISITAITHFRNKREHLRSLLHIENMHFMALHILSFDDFYDLSNSMIILGVPKKVRTAFDQ